MRIVDANQHDARVCRAVEENFVVNFRHGNLSGGAADIQEDFLPVVARVSQLRHAERSTVNVQNDVTVGGEDSARRLKR